MKSSTRSNNSQKFQKSFKGLQKWAKIIACFVIFAFLFLPSGLAAKANEKAKPKLTHEMTDAERALMPAYLESVRMRATAPPTSPVRNIAEYEAMEGVLIAYPLGIPVSLVAMMSQDVTVTTIVDSTSQESTVRSYYQSNGVNLTNCNFLIDDHDSYWTRDYGPWFVADGNRNISIMDFTYNRPRYNDNAINGSMATFLSVSLYSMDLVHCGGNYMCDGYGKAVSTDLVWEENSSKTHGEIDIIVDDYLGIDTYHVTADPLDDYIKHVDCWGKYLYVDKILIGRPPTNDPRYSDYEAVKNYFAAQTTGFGNTYRVYRVDSPSGEPYTNSLILNDKVYVPTMNHTTADNAAISTYQSAMPGYQIVGVYSSGWMSTDAIHCRVMGIADREMLYIKHIPLMGEQPILSQYPISAEIIAYSGSAIDTSSVKIYYRVDGGSLYTANLTSAGGDTYTGAIPSQASGSEITYYIYAADMSGKTANHPLIGDPDPHTFTVGTSVPSAPVAQFSADSTTVDEGDTVQFTDLSTNNPTSWSWAFTGGTPSSSTAENPQVTYNTAGTYTVALTATNAYGSDTETKTGYITVNVVTVPKAITVVSPNGGERWKQNSTQTIQWTSQGAIANVKIEYSTNGGSSWITITSSTPNDGSHAWTLPSTSKNLRSCLIKITSEDGTVSDVSNSTFRILK